MSEKRAKATTSGMMDLRMKNTALLDFYVPDGKGSHLEPIKLYIYRHAVIYGQLDGSH